MFGTIQPADKVNFVKNLSVMLKSGVTIDEALTELAEQARSTRFKKIILAVKEDVGRGSPLSASFAKYDVFDNVFKALMRTGEVSGGLEDNLIFLADWLEHENDMKKEIGSATLYPKIVIGAVITLALALNIFVLPKLLPLFTDMKVELPWTTKFLFASSRILLEYWYVAIGILLLGILSFIFIDKIPSVRKLRDAVYLRVPFFGTLMTDYEMAVISQLFYTCFKSGVPMHESIIIIRDTIENAEYRTSFTAIADHIQTGIALSVAMKAYPRLYPRQVVSILATGEKSGTLSNSFQYLAEFYSKEVRSKTKDIPTVIEPALLLFIAIMIGVIAFSIIVPIYKLSVSI